MTSAGWAWARLRVPICAHAAALIFSVSDDKALSKESALTSSYTWSEMAQAYLATQTIHMWYKNAADKYLALPPKAFTVQHSRCSMHKPTLISAKVNAKLLSEPDWPKQVVKQ